MQGKELKQFRMLNSKHILQKDKTIKVQIYNENIHYLENGEYKEIDNRIIDKSEILENKSNDFKVIFNKNDESITISKNDKVINLSLENSNMVNYEFSKDMKIRKIDSIKFNKVLNDTDIIYEIHPNKLKEKIILNKKIKFNELKYVIKTKLKLELNKDNNVVVKDGKKIIYLIEKPFMIDNNNEVSEDIRYQLDKKNNGY